MTKIKQVKPIVADLDEIKTNICAAIDKGDLFIGGIYKEEEQRIIMVSNFDTLESIIFAKGFLQHMSDILEKGKNRRESKIIESKV